MPHRLIDLFAVEHPLNDHRAQTPAFALGDRPRKDRVNVFCGDRPWGRERHRTARWQHLTNGHLQQFSVFAARPLPYSIGSVRRE